MKLCLSKAQKTAKTTQKQHQLKPFQIVPTMHKDVAERLLKINPALAEEARKVLDVNKQERHLRGGMATKEKYLHKAEK
ncbi:MAG: sporulation transcriptional regulator SpoIIID [Lachnospiraceae bacterium]|nr:sporulation transcriptional regulator SpoIIID [Lachnospiraceae bacterium]